MIVLWGSPCRDSASSSVVNPCKDSAISAQPTLRTEYIEAMSRTASSVAVVTTFAADLPVGLTVSAVTSVTADPPTLLICINRKNPIEAAIRESGFFAVNMLRADQRQVAESFAGRPRRGEAYDFAITRWERSPHGCPVFSGAVAWFDCRVVAEHAVGTHRIFIGRVEAAGSEAGMPLVYGSRSFAELLHLPVAEESTGIFPDPVWDEPEEEEAT